MEEHLVLLVDPWQEKYERLLEAHEKLQKLNQCLEEKLLKLAEERQAETTQLTTQIQDLTQRLVEARVCIHQLEDENERYRNDINVAVQLLQCKPSNFISPKIDTLPEELQRKVLGQKNGTAGRKEKKIIKVQVPTFPPTDIMYAVDKTNKGSGGGGSERGGGKHRGGGDKDIVSAAIMAKVLQERENERKENQKNRCHCASRIILPTVQKETQTMPSCTISYSDFPYLEDNSSNRNSARTNNDEDEEEVGDKYDYDNQCFAVYTTSNGTHGGRETSFSSHQSSSSLSSPTSSTTSESAQQRHHHHHQQQHHLPHQPSSVHSQYAPLHPSQHHHHHHLQHHLPHHPYNNLHTIQTQPPLGHSNNNNEPRKLPGHCVRQNTTTTSEENKESSDNEDRGESRSSSSSNSGCGGGVVNWRTTVLVQHPPKSHHNNGLHHHHHHHDSLSSLLMTSSKATPPSSLPLIPYSVSTPSSLSSSASHNNSPPSSSSTSLQQQPTTVDHLLDSSEDSGVSSSSSSSINSQLPSALLPQQLAYNNHNNNVNNTISSAVSTAISSSSTTTVTTANSAVTTSTNNSGRQQTVNGLNNYCGMNPLSSPLSAYPSLASTTQSHQPHQYYRAQKRTFWTRSSSTTSTETEI